MNTRNMTFHDTIIEIAETTRTRAEDRCTSC